MCPCQAGGDVFGRVGSGYSKSLDQLCSTRGNFASSGHPVVSQDIFLLSHGEGWGKNATGIRLVEARDGAKRSAVQRTAGHKERPESADWGENSG